MENGFLESCLGEIACEWQCTVCRKWWCIKTSLNYRQLLMYWDQMQQQIKIAIIMQKSAIKAAILCMVLVF